MKENQAKCVTALEKLASDVGFEPKQLKVEKKLVEMTVDASALSKEMVKRLEPFVGPDYENKPWVRTVNASFHGASLRIVPRKKLVDGDDIVTRLIIEGWLIVSKRAPDSDSSESPAS